MKKAYIFYNTDKPIAESMYKKSLEFFKNNNVEIVDPEKDEKVDFAVIIGGDGTILRSFKKIKNSAAFIIPINAGKLGFLASIKIEKAIEEYSNFLKGDFSYEKRGVFEIELKGKKYFALNDLVLTKESIEQNTVVGRVFADNEYVNTYKGDGIIISTSTGSTAYSLSIGGPIVHPFLNLFVITPIANHNLNTRTIIIDGQAEIDLKLGEDTEKGFIIIDGDTKKLINKNDVVKIRYYEIALKLVTPKNVDYYSILREKLKWGDNLC